MICKKTFYFTITLISQMPMTAFGYTFEDDRTTDTKHGLYEIQQEAKKFIVGENNKKGTNWRVGEPNLKIFVPRCIVPLRAEWLPKSYGASGTNVVVTCTNSVEKKVQNRWDVFVPVMDQK